MIHPLIARTWIGTGEEGIVLPDGCADLVWSDGRLLVVGPATTAAMVAATPERPRFGVRLRVGGIEAALGVPGDVLRDLEVAVAEIWPRRALDGVARAAAASAADGLAALVELIARQAVAPAPDRLVREAAGRLRDPRARLPELSRSLAIGERQLRRRFERGAGYGPRTFARVQRFQRLLLIRELAPELALARLAADAGYADQAHMTREVRRLAGCSPTELFRSRPRAAGERSDSFKPSVGPGGILTA